jgi:chromosome segregation ATPase
VLKRYETLEKRYQAATERISGELVKLGKLQGQVETQNSRITELEDNLAVKERLALRLTRQNNRLRSEEQSSDDAETPELIEVREKLELMTSRERDAHGMYKAAQEENTDLKFKLDFEIDNSAGLKEDKERLETNMATKEQELLTLRKRFAQASVEFAEAKHHIDVDGHIISGIQDEREALVKEVRQKTEDIEAIKRDWVAARKTWKTELDETLAKLERVEDEKQSLEEDLQQCEQDLKVAEEALKSLQEEHQLCAPRLKAVEEAKQILEGEHQHCGPSLKLAEEAKKFLEERVAILEAQLKEAKKPKLKNDVVCTTLLISYGV